MISIVVENIKTMKAFSQVCFIRTLRVKLFHIFLKRQKMSKNFELKFLAIFWRFKHGESIKKLNNFDVDYVKNKLSEQK